MQQQALLRLVTRIEELESQLHGQYLAGNQMLSREDLLGILSRLGASYLEERKSSDAPLGQRLDLTPAVRRIIEQELRPCL